MVENQKGFHEVVCLRWALENKGMEGLPRQIWIQGTAVTGTLRDIARVWGPSVCMLARGEKVRQAETHSRFCSR